MDWEARNKTCLCPLWCDCVKYLKGSITEKMPGVKNSIARLYKSTAFHLSPHTHKKSQPIVDKGVNAIWLKNKVFYISSARYTGHTHTHTEDKHRP